TPPLRPGDFSASARRAGVENPTCQRAAASGIETPSIRKGDQHAVPGPGALVARPHAAAAVVDEWVDVLLLLHGRRGDPVRFLPSAGGARSPGLVRDRVARLGGQAR